MKVYGIEITENYVDTVYDSNQSDSYFDTTRVYTSKQAAREQMKKLASCEYVKIIDSHSVSPIIPSPIIPTMTCNHNGDSIDVCAAYYNHRADVSMHYEVVEMELDMDKSIWPISLTPEDYDRICIKLRKQEPLTNAELIVVESIRMAYNGFGLEEALGKLENEEENHG